MYRYIKAIAAMAIPAALFLASRPCVYANNDYLAYTNPETEMEATTSTTVTVDYVGNFVYENGTLTKILFEGGYVDMTGSTPKYMYYLTDHLGNVRVVADSEGNIAQVNHYYPYGDRFNDNRYALSTSSTSNNDHLFGGKELDSSSGLHDFEARYDNTKFGKFTTMDPMAEKYYSMSPYSYCGGNPVNYLDPNGETIVIDIYGNIMSNDNNDTDIYVNQNDALTYIGALGGEVDVTDVLSNLFQKSAKESRFMNPFTLRKLVKNGGDWDLKNNQNTIWGIANKTDTEFIFRGDPLSSADIGNFHFGVVTKSNIFITEDFALKQAGKAQIAAGTSLDEWQNYYNSSLTMSTSVGIITLSTKYMTKI